MDDRVRLSLGSFEAHTAQPHLGTGTPCEVPVPRKVMVKGSPTQLPLRLAVAPRRKIFAKKGARMGLKKPGTFA